MEGRRATLITRVVSSHLAMALMRPVVRDTTHVTLCNVRPSENRLLTKRRSHQIIFYIHMTLSTHTLRVDFRLRHAHVKLSRLWRA